MTERASPEPEHTRRKAAFADEAARLDGLATRISFARLALFLVGGTMLAAAFAERSSVMGGIGLLSIVLFAAAVVWHARVFAAKERAEVRREIHDRHLRRIAGTTEALPNGTGAIPDAHPYAGDIDLVGPGSLFERYAVAHTVAGTETLARWLAAPATIDVARERQGAVVELADRRLDVREAMEAAVLDSGSEQIDARPFVEFCEGPKVMAGRPALAWVVTLLPIATLVLIALSGEVLPAGAWVPLALVQGFIARQLEPRVARAYGLVVSRRRFVESYRAILKVAEEMPADAKALIALKERLNVTGARPSVELSRLELWASLFEVRAQGLVHVVINVLLLWDANVLLRLEQWALRAGTKTRVWLETIGELEALASLATMRAIDAGSSMPDLESDGVLRAEGLAHPLLPIASRVANDVTIEGPGTALVVTGSNMAGKSTLLRAIGVNVVVALAGGPVSARSMRVPAVRLRASMRIADSLQHGASYFQAELARLRTVIEDAEKSPPILFLLDELLRGTNARARHRGARAVVLHLLARHAMGIVATHDIALSELEVELDGRVKNFHFTDVLAPDGEMIFDYRLRDGVVKTSNALRLLAMAGVEVEADDKLKD
jgi:hypothetical protein